MPLDQSPEIGERPIYLEALAIQFFRGIGPDIQKLGPFKDFNFFVGANNSGKSTVLDFIHRYLGSDRVTAKAKTATDRIDRYTGKKTGELYYALGLSPNNFAKPAFERLNNEQRLNNNLRTEFQSLVLKVSGELAKPDPVIWITPKKGPTISVERLSRLRNLFHSNEWYRLWNALKGMQGGSIENNWIPE